MADSDGLAFRRVLDALGQDIVEGRMPAGSSDTIDAIVGRTGVSRPVIREVTRVLVSLGMLSSGRRVGLRVRGRDGWDLLDPQVIRWRLDTADREAQLAELRGLRLAVEPEASRLAALRRTEPDLADLRAAVEQLAEASRLRDAVAFLEADARFHGSVLRVAGNGMLARLSSVVEAALRERTPRDELRWREAPADVELHRRVVEAIRARDSVTAGELMREIVEPPS